MNFIFEWQNNILRASAASELNIVFWGARSPGALKCFPWSPEPHRFVAWSPNIILL